MFTNMNRIEKMSLLLAGILVVANAVFCSYTPEIESNPNVEYISPLELMKYVSEIIKKITKCERLIELSNETLHCYNTYRVYLYRKECEYNMLVQEAKKVYGVEWTQLKYPKYYTLQKKKEKIKEALKMENRRCTILVRYKWGFDSILSKLSELLENRKSYTDQECNLIVKIIDNYIVQYSKTIKEIQSTNAFYT
ncbi:hypothetical protein NEFER03_0477 [Nematocida sp. LUAm3]|nr:hypothetical protein NEFER03_0477 [Nematocida sp. LUAm3]KAI5175934.1 hypothetical protein NEFER02_1794 [Nematocida sp. LUAm2]KAI5178684.1 hypothetical protein NEFER01_1803 [Nematocida sp. LUAm1]